MSALFSHSSIYNLHISQHWLVFFCLLLAPMPSTRRSQSRTELAETVAPTPRTHPPAAPAAVELPGCRGVCSCHITQWLKTVLRSLNGYREDEALPSQSINPPLIPVEITSRLQPNLMENYHLWEYMAEWTDWLILVLQLMESLKSRSNYNIRHQRIYSEETRYRCRYYGKCFKQDA